MFEGLKATVGSEGWNQLALVGFIPGISAGGIGGKAPAQMALNPKPQNPIPQNPNPKTPNPKTPNPGPDTMGAQTPDSIK